MTTNNVQDAIAKVETYLSSTGVVLVKKALDFELKALAEAACNSGDKRVEAEFERSIETAQILAELHMDEVAVASGALYGLVASNLISIEKVRSEFSDDVAGLVEGLLKISRISYSSRKESQAEHFRRLILAISADVRVVIIKLAVCLCAMRRLDAEPRDDQIKKAGEVLDIYAPLANRLGIHKVKNELEDLGFKFTMPEVYSELRAKAQRRLDERDDYIDEVKQILEDIIADGGISGRISGRPKHFLSIYRKMEAQGISFEKVYDLVAFRIIVDSLRDCYATLGAIHSRWRPVPGRFKDYIALPKSNLYQSLHTTVIGPKGQSMEVQIRTEEMHRIAEEGIAAHWRYKEKRTEAVKEDKVFEWLRQLVDHNEAVGDAQEFLDSVKIDFFPDVVFVFTPGGDLVELPRGSTPVDFAYAVHSQVGDRCVGAKVNDRMTPLSFRLKNGDRVEIATSKNHTPNADWLEFVQTAKARAKIRHWIKIQQKETSRLLGRDLCDREFRKFGKSFSKATKEGAVGAVANRYGFNKVEELLEAVGRGKIASRQVLVQFAPELAEKEAEEQKQATPKPEPKASKGIVINGIGDAMVRYARCCTPLPGEAVTGFVTRGRGITVHTTDCVNVPKLDPERRVDVEWGKGTAGAYPVKIRVACDDRKGILAAITNQLAKHDVNVAGANVRTWALGQAECNFTILVEDTDRLQKILGSIQGLKGVHSVARNKN